MFINILDILKKTNFIIDESILWSILTCGLSLIQNKISSGDYEFILLSLESINITAEGILCLKKDTSERCSRSYIMPEIIDINSEWYNADDFHKAEILLYSLGISIKKCIINGKNDLISNILRYIVNLMTDHDVTKRLTLVEVLRICCSRAKEFTKGMSYSYHLSQLYQSYKSSDKSSRMLRSLSQSNISAKNPNMIYTKQNSLGTIYSDVNQTARSHIFNRNSSTDSEKNYQSQHSSMSSPSSNVSDNSIKGTLATSNYGNLILNAIDPRHNITEALERVKARRKVIKSNGPVKLLTEISLSQSLNGSSKNFVESFNITRRSEKVKSLGPLEISTIERLGGFRYMLGPEFIIRNNETFNITSTKERRSSIFSRTSSGRLIRDEIVVHLLNGVVLLVRNLDNKSLINQIINSIHNSFPDLEFVTYGLCFSLDSEFFFLNDDVNVYKLISYISHKNNQPKTDERIVLNTPGLHLYYRIKYYPSLDTYREMNSFGSRLLYLQLRQDILSNNLPPLSIEEATSLAGLALQTEYGDNEDSLKENLEYIKMKYYFHQLFIPSFNIAEDEISFLKKLQSKWISLQWAESESAFIEKVMSKKYYGLHWYKVNKNQLNMLGAIGKETFLVLGRHFIELIDVSRIKLEVEIHKHFNYKWRQIDSITIKNKKLIIKPKMQLKVGGMTANSVFVCYLDSRTKAEYIVRLCKDHHLLASQDEDNNTKMTNNVYNNTGSHMGLCSVDYPMSLRNSIDIEDDDIFVDYASSEEDTFQNPRNSKEVSSRYKLHQLRSLQAMNTANTEESDNSPSVKAIVPTNTSQFSHLKGKYELNPVDSKNYEFQQLEKGNIKLNKKSQYKIFEIEIIRPKDESIGIGIINVNTNGIQGIFIKYVQKNSIAEQCGQILEGDEIICINNEPVSHITQEEVRTVMANCGTKILFLMRRHYHEESKSLSQTNNPLTFVKETKVSEIIQQQKQLKQSSILKSNSSFRKGLGSSNSLDIIRKNYTKIIIPSIRIKDENQTLLRKIESFAERENKGFREKSTWNLKDKKLENGSNNNIYELTINLNSLLQQKLESKINIKFIMISLRKKDDFKETFWNTIRNNESKLILSLCSRNFDKDLCWTKEDLEETYEVRVKEKCELSDGLIVQRLSLRLPNVKPNRIFQIQFCEWFNNNTNVDSMIQIVNLACLLNQNIPNNGPVVIAFDDPNIPTNLIVVYILVLLNLHSEISIDPVLSTQTLVNSIYNQLIEQSKDLIPSEVQFNACISILKLLLPLRSHCQNSPENSDIE